MSKQNDRKPFVACGFCGVKILPVIGYNTHSRHILGVHANIITAVKSTVIIYVHTCDCFSFPCICSVVGINCHKNVTSTVTIKSESSEHKRKKMLSVYFFRIAAKSRIAPSTSSCVWLSDYLKY